jgi:large subunit ribosomal protein L3
LIEKDMIQTLIGQKIEQSQKFLENGKRIPVTEIVMPKNVVLQIKTKTKEGYNAVQLGMGTKRKATKAILGISKKAQLTQSPRFIKEVSYADGESLTLGDQISVASVFAAGDMVTVCGTSKGKGFAGGVKRYHFRGGPKTHGQSDRHRAPGSIGQSTTPGRVYKGKRMAGHMGVDTVTVRNLVVVGVDEAQGKLFLLGLVPGHKNAVIFVTKTGAKKNFVPLLQIEGAAPVAEEQTSDEAAVPVTEEAVVETPETVDVKQEEAKVEAPATEEKETVAAEHVQKEEKIEEKEEK